MDWAVRRGEDDEENGNVHHSLASKKKLNTLTGGDGFAFMSSAS